MYLHAESVKVDTDEGAITLEVETSEGDRLTVNIHGIDLDAFYDSVRSGVGGYLRERDEALRTAPMPLYVDDSGYDLLDPKHPTFRDRMTAIWDNRDKTERKPW